MPPVRSSGLLGTNGTGTTTLLRLSEDEIVLLDEPINTLDLRSVDELLSALDTYRGGPIVVSHDDAFLSRLHIDIRTTLDGSGRARERASQNPKEKQ